ncbi:MAG: laminin sub domain 2 [Marmoricola sp.]|nr:laminin sub domain 2 [Marmoricola sp.]
MDGQRYQRLMLGALIAVLIIAVSAVAASAFTSGSGHGTGSGTTATTADLLLGPGTASADLFPGGTGDVVLTISNPNASPVRVGSLALDSAQGAGGFTIDSGHSGCAAASLAFSTQTNGAGWTTPAKIGAVNGTLSVTLRHAVSMNLTAANACQGATIAVYLTAGP